jgi:GGDEF domain-containing protein
MAGALASTSDVAAAWLRGAAALERLASAPDSIEDPLVVVAYETQRLRGHEPDPWPLIDRFRARPPRYGRENAMRYRWSLSWGAAAGHASYHEDSPTDHWRPFDLDRLEADPTAFGRQLMEPLTIAAHLRFWGDLADQRRDLDAADFAATLLAEAMATMEHDVASWFLGRDPWRDTFGLWLLSADPHATRMLRHMVLSLALRYGAIAAHHGVIVGLRHPFFETPLVSASAHVAAGLWRMGLYPTALPKLVDLLTSTRTTEGSWSDGDQPPDILTTLAAADVLARLDPSFDPEPTVGWFLRHQEADGWWRALGPEVPWLTAAVMAWLDRSTRSFEERFEWPTSPVWAQDRLTGLTTMATLDELAMALERLPGLRDQVIEAAFLDLAGFGEWNTRHGQSRGDDLLAVLGRTLSAIPEVLPVRIGGDEFLILAKPGQRDLGSRLDEWRVAWPAALMDAAMPANVAPRILLDQETAGRLPLLRRRLGEGIGPLKAAQPAPPPSGVIARVT